MSEHYKHTFTIMKTENNKTNYEAVKNALATLDTRFAVYEEHDDEEHTRDYTSIRKVLNDNTIDEKNRIFAIYFRNNNRVTIKCAYRFHNVCDACESYKLSSNKMQYVRNVSLDELAECVHALLTDECERLKMSKYTQNVQKTTARKASTAKKKNA